MARKKTFKYKFLEGVREVPTNTIVTCTKTGEKTRFHHKQLVRLIQKKYNNSWGVFMKTYTKKEKRTVKTVDEETAPEGYRKFLILMYISTKNSKTLSKTEQAWRLDHYTKCYHNRYRDNIERVIGK